MWGATFVSTKVLLKYFLPVEILLPLERVHCIFGIVDFLPAPSRKFADKKRELGFAGRRFLWDCDVFHDGKYCINDELMHPM